MMDEEMLIGSDFFAQKRQETSVDLRMPLLARHDLRMVRFREENISRHLPGIQYQQHQDDQSQINGTVELSKISPGVQHFESDDKVLVEITRCSSVSSLVSSSIPATMESDVIEDVHYLLHTILPTDTLQGLCISYKITATKLRQVNNFSGSNLLFAPKRLVVPLTDETRDKIKLQDRTSRKYKIHSLLAEFPGWLRRLDYAEKLLHESGWDLGLALDAARCSGILDCSEDEKWRTDRGGLHRHRGPAGPVCPAHAAAIWEELFRSHQSSTSMSSRIRENLGLALHVDNIDSISLGSKRNADRVFLSRQNLVQGRRRCGRIARGGELEMRSYLFTPLLCAGNGADGSA